MGRGLESKVLLRWLASGTFQVADYTRFAARDDRQTERTGVFKGRSRDALWVQVVAIERLSQNRRRWSSTGGWVARVAPASRIDSCRLGQHVQRFVWLVPRFSGGVQAL